MDIMPLSVLKKLSKSAKNVRRMRTIFVSMANVPSGFVGNGYCVGRAGALVEAAVDDGAGDTLEEPIEEAAGALVGELIEDPIDEPIEEPAGEPIDEPTEEPIEEPTEEFIWEPAEEPIDEALEELMNEPLDPADDAEVTFCTIPAGAAQMSAACSSQPVSLATPQTKCSQDAKRSVVLYWSTLRMLCRAWLW